MKKIRCITTVMFVASLAVTTQKPATVKVGQGLLQNIREMD